MSKDDFFIGWADTPAIDRRFFVRAGLALMAGTAATAGTVAALQEPAGPGDWAMGDIREWRGIATSEPYAMLRTLDLDGTPRTALLGCQGKCGVAARIGALAGKPVIVKGSLIQRGRHAMIAVADGMDWIAEDPAGSIGDLAFPTPTPLTQVSLEGEVLDSKCWFGAMRPSEGKVHKSCASLCIRGGIPPAFYVKDRADQAALMIMTDAGAAHGQDLLEFVADPVSISGNVQRFGDLLLLDAPVSAISRI
ncbi:MAG: hypothetical protein AAFQ22_00900 [Pseudomonadota bacterium]